MIKAAQIKNMTVLRFELRLPEPQSGVLTTRRHRLQLNAYLASGLLTPNWWLGSSKYLQPILINNYLQCRRDQRPTEIRNSCSQL
jgi:hypothetical protein